MCCCLRRRSGSSSDTCISHADRHSGRAAACTFLPVIYCFFVSQCGVVLLSLSVFALVALQARREWLAGALIACTLLKPQYTLALALLLLARRMWRSLAGFAGVAAFLALLPLPVALTILVLIVTAIRSDRIEESFAVAIIAGLLISPHTQAYDLTVILLPAAVLIRLAGRAEVMALACVIYVGTAVGFAVGYLTPVHPVPIVLTALMLRLTAKSMARRPVFNLRSRVRGAATASM